jgi:hypothetical protein
MLLGCTSVIPRRCMPCDAIEMKINSTILIFLACSCGSSPEHESQERPAAVLIDTSRKIEDLYDFDKGALFDHPVRLTVNYVARGGAGAQWVESKTIDTINYRNYFYLERADANIIDADTLFNGMNLPIRLELTGQFYDKVGYPEHYQSIKGSPEPAKVFRYKMIEIIKK